MRAADLPRYAVSVLALFASGPNPIRRLAWEPVYFGNRCRNDEL